MHTTIACMCTGASSIAASHGLPAWSQQNLPRQILAGAQTRDRSRAVPLRQHRKSVRGAPTPSSRPSPQPQPLLNPGICGRRGICRSKSVRARDTGSPSYHALATASGAFPCHPFVLRVDNMSTSARPSRFSFVWPRRWAYSAHPSDCRV